MYFATRRDYIIALSSSLSPWPLTGLSTRRSSSSLKYRLADESVPASPNRQYRSPRPVLPTRLAIITAMFRFQRKSPDTYRRRKRLTILGRSIFLLGSELAVNVVCWVVAGILFGRSQGTRPILSLALLAWVRRKFSAELKSLAAHIMNDSLSDDRT